MLNNSALATAEKVLKTQYNEAIGAIQATNPFIALRQVATVIQSEGSEESYGWLGEMPQAREWLGDLVIEDLSNYQYTLRNRHFAVNVGIDKDELDDDKFGLIKPRVAGLALRAEEYVGRLLHDLILNGTTYKAYDGVAFFSAATGVRVNNNLLTGTLSAGTPTIAQMEADIDAMRVAMSQFVDGKGEVMGIVMDTIVVHPSMERIVRQVVQSTYDPSTATTSSAYNPFNGWIKNIIVDPLLSDKNDMYGLCLSYPVKPFVWQERQTPSQWLTVQDTNRKAAFVCDFRGAAGLSFPFLAVKSVSAVA